MFGIATFYVPPPQKILKGLKDINGIKRCTAEKAEMHLKHQ
jgi:hypothetical protein